jgi:hypothetical protein
MKLILQPNMWSCLPTCVSMLTDQSLADIYTYVGHDGSEELFPDEPFPMNHQSFTVNEIMDYLLEGGWLPVYLWNEDGNTLRFSLRMSMWLAKYNAILLSGPEKPHAVVWCRDEKMVWNPLGFKTKINEFPCIAAILLPEKKNDA